MSIAEKVRSIIDQPGWTQERLAEELGVAQSSVHRWLAGADPRGSMRDAINEIYDRLLGEAREPIRTVPIVGLAGAGPDGSVLFATADENLGETPAPFDATASTVALEVRGESMRGIANDGWLIFYDERTAPSEEHHGEPCVCWLEDDRVLVKFVYPGRGPGLFDLESTNAVTMRDVPVRYLALVTDIKPRKSAQKYIRRNPDIQNGNGKTGP